MMSCINILDRFVVLYLDDIVNCGESLKKYEVCLNLVFSMWREYVLYVKRKKCEFSQKKIELFRHIVS